MQMENGMIVLFQVGNLPVTAYAVAVALALGIGIALLGWQCKTHGLKAGTATTYALWALPISVVCARLFYCLCRLSLYGELGYGSMLKLWNGGYALWGAIGGMVFSALLVAKLSKQKTVKLLDALAAPGALTLALIRFAEVLNGEGIGMYVENEAFWRFPFAVCNEWGEWYWAIFLLEGLAALVIGAVLLRKKRAEGDDAKLFFVLFGTVSVVLESLRRDNFLRWLFVRVSQLSSVLVLVGIMVWAVVYYVRHQESRRISTGNLVLCWVVYVLMAGCCIALEFAVDKSATLPVWAAYCLMTVCSIVMGVCAYRVVMKASARPVKE